MNEDTDQSIVEYITDSNSPTKATVVNEIILSETKTTCRILKPDLVKNDKNPKATVKFTIIHKRNKKDGVEEEKPPDLRKMTAGEHLSCKVNSAETLILFNSLSRLYDLSHNNTIFKGKNKYYVTRITNLSHSDSSNLAMLFNKCSDFPKLAKNLAKLSPKLIKEAHYHYSYHKKIKGVDQFKSMLQQECNEQDWQKFFKEHDWILGGVHDIQYLSDVCEKQPNFSSANVQGKNANKGDFLKCTSGSARFTAIVEIKSSKTPLLEDNKYRSNVYIPSKDLNGGLAQLRTYLRKWQIDGSRTEENKDMLETQDIYTVQPMGILIIGHHDDIKKERAKREAFQMFKYNQKDVHIVTFDEVLGRAEGLLGCDKKLLGEMVNNSSRKS